MKSFKLIVLSMFCYAGMNAFGVIYTCDAFETKAKHNAAGKLLSIGPVGPSLGTYSLDSTAVVDPKDPLKNTFTFKLKGANFVTTCAPAASPKSKQNSVGCTVYNPADPETLIGGASAEEGARFFTFSYFNKTGGVTIKCK